jgi:hypothetical protein
MAIVLIERHTVESHLELRQSNDPAALGTSWQTRVGWYGVSSPRVACQVLLHSLGTRSRYCVRDETANAF